VKVSVAHAEKRLEKGRTNISAINVRGEIEESEEGNKTVVDL